jgi:hypothetical protein
MDSLKDEIPRQTDGRAAALLENMYVGHARMVSVATAFGLPM